MSNEIKIIDNKYLVLTDDQENSEGEEKGASSIVYKVEDMKTKEVYAAKVLKNEKCRHNFDNEIEFLNYLKEKGIKNIVNIIDSGDGDYKEGNSSSKKKYLILEYAEKKDLTRYISHNLKNEGFSELDSHAQLLFSKILEAIKAIHESGVCHRDIKTDNILLHNEFNPKICDFGFSTYINLSFYLLLK
jgi:serine/threonine protein kinase